MEVSLSSKSDLGKSPKYLHGKRPHLKTLDMGKRKSSVVIVNDRGNGEVDAFYMYFYTFNQGPMVLGHELGDHLGDWYVSLSYFLSLLSQLFLPRVPRFHAILFYVDNLTVSKGTQHDPFP